MYFFERYYGGLCMKSGKPVITVVGSFMMDLVIKAERRPKVGETLIGQSFGMFVGGKGFNQAVSAARLGAEVRMVGRLGADDFGQRFLKALEKEGIDSTFVSLDQTASTGVGSPVIDAHGDNSIIIIPGANMNLTPQDVEKAADLIAGSDVVMLQLEIPLETVKRTAEIAHQAGAEVLLNPAPARALSDDILQLVSIITPNETEAELLTGKSVGDDTTAYEAACLLQKRGVGAVVLTLGKRGAMFLQNGECQRVPGYSVKVVDTTAAGDAFCAGLAVQLANHQPLEKALSFANAVGALATTVVGAEPSMLPLEQVLRFLAGQEMPSGVKIHTN
jgi:ribokinase